ALNDGTGDLTAIHESYIPVAASDRGEDAVGNRYCKRITGHYAVKDAA
ncbi:MAG: hypothetical protein IT381_23815, partial [Deltaproteobacteria bacterium]|nr:hypothetical protein [Deltaproteobacteria bacterium]